MRPRTSLSKSVEREIRNVFPWKEREQTGKGMKKPAGVPECSSPFFHVVVRKEYKIVNTH